MSSYCGKPCTGMIGGSFDVSAECPRRCHWPARPEKGAGYTGAEKRDKIEGRQVERHIVIERSTPDATAEDPIEAPTALAEP